MIDIGLEQDFQGDIKYEDIVEEVNYYALSGRNTYKRKSTSNRGGFSYEP